MPNVRIGEAFHKLDGTPYGTGKSLFVTERKSVMVKQIKISNFTEVKNIMNAATHCVDEIGVHDGKGSIADAKSILGLIPVLGGSLDYTHPVMLVSENEKELQRVYEAIS